MDREGGAGWDGTEEIEIMVILGIHSWDAMQITRMDHPEEGPEPPQHKLLRTQDHFDYSLQMLFLFLQLS